MNPANQLIAVTPIELANAPWISWRLGIGQNGKPTKVPYVIGTDKKASVSDPSTWRSFEDAVTAHPNLNDKGGLGYVHCGQTKRAGLVSLDLDGCRDPGTGDLTPWAEEIIEATGDSFGYVSPTGTGIRIVVKGLLPSSRHVFRLGPSAGYGPAAEKVQIEIFDDRKYFTYTSEFIFEDAVIENVDLTKLVALFYDIQKRYPVPAEIRESENRKLGSAVPIVSTGNILTTRYELFMNGTAEGDKPTVIRDEFGNSMTYEDRSGADMGLCNCLALRHGDDPDRIWADYLASPLRRDRWEKREDDFRRLTIKKAIDWALSVREKTNSTTAAVPEPVSIAEDSQLAPSGPYDMTVEELTCEMENEFPVLRLHETPGPSFTDEDLYGPLGQVTKKICQFSEGHPMTVYLNLLITIGSAIGRGPYFNVGGTRHYCNEFLACVGESSVSRKGTSSDDAESFLRLVCSDFMQRRNLKGFASPQAAIEMIKDASEYKIRDRKTGAYKTVSVPGIDDKRLLIRESELSGVFKLMADHKTRAAELFRDFWDGKAVSNLVAGKMDSGESRSLRCNEPMVSVIGTTTRTLAAATLPLGADTSGDGNRFIWCYTKRLQLCPHGGPSINWASETVEYAGRKVPLLVYFQEVFTEACGASGERVFLVSFTKPAWKYWTHLYARLENDKRADFLGRMTSRDAAHIRRIAMILCLIDREQSVDVKHLRAAERIWDYSQDSLQFIFRGYSLHQAKILQFAETKGAAGIAIDRELHAVFGNHKPASWLKTQIRGLVEGGFLAPANGKYIFKRR